MNYEEYLLWRRMNYEEYLLLDRSATALEKIAEQLEVFNEIFSAVARSGNLRVGIDSLPIVVTTKQ